MIPGKLNRLIEYGVVSGINRLRLTNRENMASRISCRFLSSDNEHEIMKQLDYYGKKKQTSVSLRALMETGQGAMLNMLDSRVDKNSMTKHEKICIQVAGFLHRELPIRLAHRAIELEASPLFMKCDNIRNVCNWYKKSFVQLRSCQAPTDLVKEAEFAKTIELIYERHSATLMTMARGAHELRTFLGHDINAFAEHSDIQRRLDDFYMSRIGIRMLIGQYLALRHPVPSNGSMDMVGLISPNASISTIAKHAIEDAAYMCRRQHGDAPEVTIHGRTDLTFPYVPSHISYLLLELLKNSMRATVETHGIDNMPKIRVIIADGEDNEDVALKISDEGGGIRRSNMSRIWSYLYTTADPDVLNRMLSVDSTSNPTRDFDVSSPLAGLGYGLPIARNYARFFGGDMFLMSMEGYGTDSFIYLPRLGGDKSSVV